jgi:DegV family protein with EDD domain
LSFQIIGDSCCDYPYLEDDYTWLVRVPLSIELDGENYIDDKSLRCSILISKMAASSNAPKSACPAPGSFYEAYDCGVDDVYVVTLSDKLSGSYNSAVVAANMFKESNPNKNIFVFSSHSAAAGEIAICHKIQALATSGVPFAEIVTQTLDFINKLTTYFILETLEVFRKNGRLNHLQSIITGALKLRLVMGADEVGNICVRGKALSMDRGIIKMAEQIADKCKDMDMSERSLFITHCQCPDRARFARDVVMKKVGFKDCQILKAGGISTIYANAGGFILAY